MKLLIISHTPHYRKEDQVVGWGSTIREIDHLARIFTDVTHLAPLYQGTAPDSSLPYTNPKVRFAPVGPAGGNSLLEKMSYLWQIPDWIAKMRFEINKADAIHLRCPAGISLVGLLVYCLLGKRKPCWVKYAGNWQPGKKDPASYKLQRILLQKNIHHGVVTVNGQWLGQPNHVTSFINPSFSKADWTIAKSIAKEKQLALPLELLFVGRVEEEKGVGRVIEIAAGLLDSSVDFHFTIVGDGKNRSVYEDLVRQMGLADRFSFVGWINRQKLTKYYERASMILLPSTASEGWPKVLSEAMAYGVVPLASDVSSIPQIFKETGAGHAFPAEETRLFVDQILQYTQDRSSWKEASKIAVEAADRFTYETYLEAVKNLFYKRWKVELNAEE